MKRLLLLICTILCANVLLAQDFFLAGQLYYAVTSNSSVEVYGYNSSNPPTDLVIPETVTYQGTTFNVTGIDEMAFCYYLNGEDWVLTPCTTLTSVTIPNSVTSIKDRAFYDCRSLTSITIPNSVTTIGESAFNYCSSLTSVSIPNSVTSIGGSAFRNCSSLTSVSIGNSVTDIGAYAFYNCSSLTSIDIPNSVTSIGGSAFRGCTSLTSVTIPNSVTSIGNYAFEDCSSLTSVSIGNSVTSIGNRAFWGCSSLTSITIPNSVTSIEDYAFYNCSSLTSVTLPNNATISNNAFEGIIITIDSISYAGRDTLVIGNYTLTNIGFITFYLNDTAYNSIDLIGEVVVYACDKSKSGDLIIPSTININGNNFNVISIDELAFWGCSNLTSITIPNSVTSIKDLAFYDCSSLSSFTCLAVNPPTLDDGVFYNTPNEKSLIVPCGALDNYINSDWNDDFADRITEEEGYNAVANVNNSAFGSVTVEGECYSATLTAVANACYEFLNWNDGNTENPRLVTLSSDTTLTANFEVMVVNNNITATICQGQTYTENGFNVSEAGVYTQSLQSVNGCDSVVTLNLNVNPVYNTDLFASICEGEVYNENGFNVNEAGVYSRTLQAVNGCDSVVNLTLSVNPIFNTNLSAFICEGETYSENGFNVSEAGTYTQTLQTINGCDSIVTLTLNVNPVFNTPLTATICEGSVYNENGFNVSEAGTYTQSLQSVNGCDSIVTLTLNVNPVFNTSLTATICEGSAYTENGFNVSEAGVYTQTLQTINGCDSIVTLTLNVNPIYNTELSATICEGQVYTENNFNVSEAGVYTQTLQTVNGCDSIVTLTLNVNPIYNTELTATICEGQVYTENNFNVSEAGVYTQTLTSVNGCDSIVTLTLNILPSYNTNLTATICEGSELNISGFNVTEGGVYTQTYTAVNGCDSIVTLTVTENPTIHTNLTLTICEGTSLNFSGFNVSEAGVYTQTHTSVNGCDSIVTLTVTELPTVHTDLTLTICEGTSLNFSGFNVSEAGVYTQTHTAVNGCDSIVTLTVSVNPTFDTTINATINPGETYAEFGFNESEAGTYVQNLQTEFGCDSTITLVLSVNSSLLEAEIEEISFYPNPTNSKITFSQAIEKVEVIDLTGKTIFTFSNANSINIESLPSGAYYLRLTNDEKTIMRKVIKQ